mgnify:CR=1 FL=1
MTDPAQGGFLQGIPRADTASPPRSFAAGWLPCGEQGLPRSTAGGFAKPPKIKAFLLLAMAALLPLRRGLRHTA